MEVEIQSDFSSQLKGYISNRSIRQSSELRNDKKLPEIGNLKLERSLFKSRNNLNTSQRNVYRTNVPNQPLKQNYLSTSFQANTMIDSQSKNSEIKLDPPSSSRNNRMQTKINRNFSIFQTAQDKFSESQVLDIPQKKDKWGIDGYMIRKFDPFLDKTQCVKIKDSKIKSFIDDAVKQRDFMPSPQSYDVRSSLIDNKNHSFGVGQRITIPVLIEQREKKELKPGPGAYNAKQQQRRILGAFNLRDQKTTGFIEEAMYRSSQSPTSYECNYDIVQEKSPKVKMLPPKYTAKDISKIEKNDLPSPTTYNPNESFNQTQTRQSIVKIHKGTILKFIDNYAKSRKFVPGAGTYNPDSCYNLITKGASKGWK
ncbi:UNKNOWN [Stylonychia lemnae]|uniref:Uncharacterized protein n=1 Tax=Stylonychia lemnae TaxID=5949 RepID=A0A078AGQ4_STYLE|nr:UNKNOWN [Stylonychia lemnae]|eukprot:CDW81465.1 UNKNOWN [Stylonychia lemnae]